MMKQEEACKTALPSLPGSSPAGFSPAMRRDEAQRRLTRLFMEADLPMAALDARLLLCAALGIDHASLIRDPHQPLGEKAEVLTDFCQRRLAHEPVSRIIGTREFWSLDFTLDPAVLDPRPDTETLIESVSREAERRGRAPRTILDLGTGSSAILAALLMQWPHAYGIGVDLSPRACAIAAGNLASLGLSGRSSIVCGHWSAALHGRFDLIVSNPPYISHGEIEHLAPEVRLHDPHLALDGGVDGFDAYRALLPPLPSLLAEGGFAALECGAGQMPVLKQILRKSQLEPFHVGLDLGGHERVVLAYSLLDSNFSLADEAANGRQEENFG